MAVAKKGGRWYVVLSYKEGDAYKKQWLTPSYRDKKDAQAQERRLRVDLDQRRDKPYGSTVTVSEYVKAWFDAYKGRAEESSVYARWGLVRRYIGPVLGTGRLSEVTAENVEYLYAQLRARKPPLSETTIGHVHTLLKQIFRHAMRRRHIAENPMELVEAPKLRRREYKVFNENTLAEVLEAVRGHHLADVFYLAMFTGMRRTEIALLKWDNVNLDRGTITVQRQTTKTEASPRTITIDPEIVERLRQRPRTGPWVFPNSTGDHYNPSSFSRHFKALVGGRLGVRFHDQRHTHASLLLENNVKAPEVAARLGHSSIAITMKYYAHRIPGQERVASERFSEVVARGRSKSFGEKFVEDAPDS